MRVPLNKGGQGMLGPGPGSHAQPVLFLAPALGEHSQRWPGSPSCLFVGGTVTSWLLRHSLFIGVIWLLHPLF